MHNRGPGMAFETDHSIGSCFANGYVSGSLVYDTDKENIQKFRIWMIKADFLYFLESGAL